MKEENNTINIKKCPKCGHELMPEAMFCVNCGTNISRDDNYNKNIEENKRIKDIKSREKTNKKYRIIKISAILCPILILVLTPFVYALIRGPIRDYRHELRAKRLLRYENLDINDINDINNNMWYIIHILKKAYDGKHKYQYILGETYYEGRYVKQNFERAYFWFEKTTEEYIKSFSNNINNNEEIKCIDEIRSALFYLGVFNDFGYYIQVNHEKACKYYEMAASLGDTLALYNLGIHYRDGIGVIQDFSKSFDYLYEGAEKGNPSAQCEIGICYLEGRGTMKNIQAAIKWLTKATEKSSNDIAQCILGKLYLNGEGVPKDIKKAKEFLNTAKQYGNEEAKRILRELNDSE
ncbi:MAG: SEL1-like repeat protein [Victivallales bacterium]|nr:SEL1-like repeat protein [Victivallales bacterium]